MQIPREARLVKSLLEVDHVTKRFGGIIAVNDLTFSLDEGETLGLIGPNGSGKTTLFNVISGVFAPTSGAVWFKGSRVDGLRAHEVCRLGVGRTFQIVQPFPHMTALDTVLVATFQRNSLRRAAEAEARSILDRVGLAHKAETGSDTLTLLELKRLEVARALATSPTLLLLDEVAAGLTEGEIDEVLDLVRSLQTEGLSFVIVEHVMQVILGIPERVLVIDFGRRVAEGTPQEVFSDKAVQEAYLGGEGNLAGSD